MSYTKWRRGTHVIIVIPYFEGRIIGCIRKFNSVKCYVVENSYNGALQICTEANLQRARP